MCHNPVSPWICACVIEQVFRYANLCSCMFTLCAKLSGAVYCKRSCLWVCLFVRVLLCVCGSVTTITRNCVHRSHQTGFVGKGSDHLQLIKFWPSCAPGDGVCGGANFFGSALLQPARSVCASLSAFFILYNKLCGAVCSAAAIIYHRPFKWWLEQPPEPSAWRS